MRLLSTWPLLQADSDAPYVMSSLSHQFLAELVHYKRSLLLFSVLSDTSLTGRSLKTTIMIQEEPTQFLYSEDS